MKNKIRMFLFFICFVILSSSVLSVINTEITTVNNCVGTIKLKVLTNNSINYSIGNCNKVSGSLDMWECRCRNSTTIFLETMQESDEIFNFRVEYILGIIDKNDITTYQNMTTEQLEARGYIRRYDIPNIRPQNKQIISPTGEVLKMPSLTTGVIIAILGVIFVVFAIVMVVWKIVLREKQSKQDYEREQEQIKNIMEKIQK
jgi:hypothetical protein